MDIKERLINLKNKQRLELYMENKEAGFRYTYSAKEQEEIFKNE